MKNLQPHTVCVWCQTTLVPWVVDTTSYCRPSRGNVWYNCDDRSISRLRTPVETSAAYLLFYNSLQNVWVLLLVPMVLLFCGVRIGVGGELLDVSGWEGMGDWCLACGGSGGLRFSGRRMRVVECFGPFPILTVPLISHNNNTHAPTAWCWELLFYVTSSGWLLTSPPKCFWPVCWTVSEQASGFVRSMTCVAFPWLWELSRDLLL